MRLTSDPEHAPAGAAQEPSSDSHSFGMVIFHAAERIACLDFAAILKRVVARGETCLITSEGYLRPEDGPLVAIVPVASFLKLLSDPQAGAAACAACPLGGLKPAAAAVSLDTQGNLVRYGTYEQPSRPPG